jgi:hypothetical protein
MPRPASQAHVTVAFGSQGTPASVNVLPEEELVVAAAPEELAPVEPPLEAVVVEADTLAEVTLVEVELTLVTAEPVPVDVEPVLEYAVPLVLEVVLDECPLDPELPLVACVPPLAEVAAAVELALCEVAVALLLDDMLVADLPLQPRESDMATTTKAVRMLMTGLSWEPAPTPLRRGRAVRGESPAPTA